MLAVGATDDNRTEGSVTRKVGEALHRIDPTRVVAMDLMQVSVKDSENYTVKSVGMRSARETQLLEGMVAWAQKSGVITGEDVFTRRALDSFSNWSKKSLLAENVSAVKRIAEDYLGLSSRFSLSLGNQKSGITQMASSGMDRDELLIRFNHLGKSNTSERAY